MTAGIAGVTLLVSALLIVGGLMPRAAGDWGFVPAAVAAAAGPGGSPWLTPLSATLIHVGWAHLALNLVMLVFAGQQVEKPLGGTALVMLYVVGAYAAALGQWLVSPNSIVPGVGASGAVSALVAAYALLYGRRRPGVSDAVHVAWLGAAWVGIQMLVTLTDMGGGGNAIGAHVGGFIAGLMLTQPLLLWRYRGA